MPTVPCTHCGGTGRIELTGVFADTLDLLRRQKVEVTAADLSRLDGCAATAMSMRLGRLEGLGLVTSRRYGRLRLYRVIANGTE